MTKLSDASVWNPDWRYVKACQMGPDYLRERFRQIQEQLDREKREREAEEQDDRRDAA